MHAVTTPQTAKPHKDNIFGICNAVGEDFGFNPFFLRLAFAVALLASPEITLATYVGLGVVVLASRLLTRQWRARNPIAVSPAEQRWSTPIPDVRVDERILEAA